MFVLYFIIIFFIIIFNVLIPSLTERMKITEQIFTSENGQKINKINCFNNMLFYLYNDFKSGKILHYGVKDNKICDCKTKPDKLITCGLKGEFNNKNHPCYTLLTELLFYRTFQ